MRRLSYCRCILLILVALAVAAAPGAQSFDANSVGDPGSNAPAELFLPSGQGPFPAMVVLHGCDGVSQHYRIWARQLAAWGYVAILVDSFRPRGTPNVCNRGQLVPPSQQAADAFAAAAYLRTRSDVRPDRIGVIGFSHGGWAVLKAVLADAVAANGGQPFVAGVAFYPGCDPPTAPLATDTLILIGDADDWTPPQRCVRWHDTAQTNGHALSLTLYPGAYHGFDAPRPPHVYFGHMTGRDPAAAEDALAQTQRFLNERLMR